MQNLPFSGGGGSSGADTALSNLASVAINTTLVSDTDNTDDLGTSSIYWKDAYLKGTTYARTILAAPAAASPVVLAINAGGARGGTDTDTAGANSTIGSGQGTGAGAASSILFQTPTVGGSGTTAQTMATRFTVATASVTSAVQVIVPDGSAGSPGIRTTTEAHGFYRQGSATFGVSVAGSHVARFGSGASNFGCDIIDTIGLGFSTGTGARHTLMVPVSAGIMGFYGASTSTAGGIQPAQSANGCTLQIRTISELLTLSTSGTTTDTTANLLPAGAIILSVMGRVTTTITTATDWQIGDPTTAGRFTAPNATMTADTTDIGRVHMTTGIASATTGIYQSAAAKVRITTTGTPGAGAIRLTTTYILLTPPTS